MADAFSVVPSLLTTQDKEPPYTSAQPPLTPTCTCTQANTHAHTQQPSFQNKVSMLRITCKALLFTDSALANWTLAAPLVPKHSSTSCLRSSQFLQPELLSMRTVVWSSPVLGTLHLYVTLSTVLQDPLILKKKNAIMDLLQNQHSIPMKLGHQFSLGSPLPLVLTLQSHRGLQTEREAKPHPYAAASPAGSLQLTAWLSASAAPSVCVHR